jgi:hypothetical protein
MENQARRSGLGVSRALSWHTGSYTVTQRTLQLEAGYDAHIRTTFELNLRAHLVAKTEPA